MGCEFTSMVALAPKSTDMGLKTSKKNINI